MLWAGTACNNACYVGRCCSCHVVRMGHQQGFSLTKIPFIQAPPKTHKPGIAPMTAAVIQHHILAIYMVVFVIGNGSANCKQKNHLKSFYPGHVVPNASHPCVIITYIHMLLTIVIQKAKLTFILKSSYLSKWTKTRYSCTHHQYSGWVWASWRLLLQS